MSARTLLAANGLYVLAVDTPKTEIRSAARELVRAALRTALARLLAVGEESIALCSVPGTPLRLAPPWAHIGLSVSHEAGLSLAAIHLRGKVGIDLLRLNAPIADLESVAADYLGPAAAQAIAAWPPAARPAAFAQAWTRLEAGLKCLGMPLQEWTPGRDTALGHCVITGLEMQNGLLASVATSPSSLRLP